MARPSASRNVFSGFIRRVTGTDLLVIIWAVWGAQLIRFGTAGEDTKLTYGAANFLDIKYAVLTVALIAVWLLMLRLQGAYDRRLLSHGPEEYRAVAAASLRLFAKVAIASYVFRLEVARGYGHRSASRLDRPPPVQMALAPVA